MATEILGPLDPRGPSTVVRSIGDEAGVDGTRIILGNGTVHELHEDIDPVCIIGASVEIKDGHYKFTDTPTGAVYELEGHFFEKHDYGQADDDVVAEVTLRDGTCHVIFSPLPPAVIENAVVEILVANGKNGLNDYGITLPGEIVEYYLGCPAKD